MNLHPLFRLSREIGLNPLRLRLLSKLPQYFSDLREWKRKGGTVSTLYPVLGDRGDQAGTVASAYFHQDLLVARMIFAAAPHRHVDVGSRVDGFVAHVAVFREIEVIDIRPMQSKVRNVQFIKADLMSDSNPLEALTDSLSCLHALEHFGLGRYGDPIDNEGHLRGFNALIRMLKPGATLYLSFPIGRPAVEFNAHRVLHCIEILSWPGAECLQLCRFDFIDDAADLHEDVPLDRIEKECSSLNHGCGIYTFKRRS